MGQNDDYSILLCCAGCGEIATTAGQFLDDGRWVCNKVCREKSLDLTARFAFAAVEFAPLWPDEQQVARPPVTEFAEADYAEIDAEFAARVEAERYDENGELTPEAMMEERYTPGHREW